MAAQRVLKRLNITPDRIDEIKKVSMEKIIEAMQGELYIPVNDCVALPENSFGLEVPALSSNIPMMIGNNHDETTLFIGLVDSTTLIFLAIWFLPKLKSILVDSSVI